MAATRILLESPGEHRPAASTRGSGCPLASNCSCVFQRFQPTATAVPSHTAAAAATPSGILAADVATWIEWGWNVARSDDTEVVMERRRVIPFCFHLGLTVVTGLLWLIYWIPRARHPRTEMVTLTLAGDGTVTASARLH